MKSPTEVEKPLTAEERAAIAKAGQEIEKTCSDSDYPLQFDMTLVCDTLESEARAAG